MRWRQVVPRIISSEMLSSDPIQMGIPNKVFFFKCTFSRSSLYVFLQQYCHSVESMDQDSKSNWLLLVLQHPGRLPHGVSSANNPCDSTHTSSISCSIFFLLVSFQSRNYLDHGSEQTVDVEPARACMEPAISRVYYSPSCVWGAATYLATTVWSLATVSKKPQILCSTGTLPTSEDNVKQQMDTSVIFLWAENL